MRWRERRRGKGGSRGDRDMVEMRREGPGKERSLMEKKNGGSRVT